jgi:Uma2 family endonuclease
MEAARVLPMSVADYLTFEESSAVRHEYVAGEIHAMSGASRAHNVITGNIYAALRNKLRGGPCQIFINDFKVRLDIGSGEFFYYPDVVVSCHPAGIEKYFLRSPTLVVEVLSESTETTDRREKHTNYRHARTLEEYVLVAQDRREVTIFRRATGWQGEIFTAPEAVVEFRSVQQSLTLAEIYETVFSAPERA